MYSMYTYLNILAHYPRVQEKIQEELDEEVGSARPVSLDDKDRLPYTQACVIELLRYVITTYVPRPCM